MKKIVKIGATSEIWEIFIADSSSTTGAGLTGLVFNSASLTAYYHRNIGTTATSMTLVTMTVGTFTSLGFKEIDATNMPGWYQFCPPDAAFATGTGLTTVSFHLKGATNMAPLPIEVQVVPIDLYDTVRAGLTALPNAAAEASGGLYTRGTGAGQINQPANGMVDVNDVRLLGTAYPAPTVAGIPNVNVKTWNDLTTVALPLIPTTAGRTLDVSAGGEAGVDWSNVGSPTTSNALTGTTIATTQKVDIETIKTNPVVNGGTVTLPTNATLASTTNITAGVMTTTTNLTTNNDKTGYGLSSAAIQTIWDALTSALTTSGSIGKWILDKLDVVLSTRLAASSYTAPLDAAGVRTAVGLGSANLDTQLSTIDDFLDTEIAAIKAKTDNLPSDPADASDIAASFSSIASTLSTIASYIDTEVAAIKAKTDQLVFTVANQVDANALSGSLNAAGIRSAVGLASANLDTQLGTIDDFLDTEVAAIKAQTDLIPSDPADASDIAALLATVQSDLDDIQSRLPAALTTDGNLKADILRIAGTVQTAGDAIALLNAIKAKSDNLPTDPADASDIAASFSSITSTLSTIAGYIDTEVAAIKAKTDQLVFTVANQVDANALSGSLSAAGIRSAVGLGSANLDTQLDALPTNAELATSQATADDAVLAAIAALNNLSAAQVNTEVDTALTDYDAPTHTELTTELATSDDAVLAAVDDLKNLMEADTFINTSTTPWTLEFRLKGTATVLISKELFQLNGSDYTAATQGLGRTIEP